MDSEKIIDSIKKASRDLFRRYGYNKTSVNEIAHKAKIAKATIYKYYDSKELILHSILLDYLEKSVKELVVAFQPEEDEKIQFAQLILRTSRISFTACNEFIGWDFIRESSGAQEFLKKFSNELEELLFEAFSQIKNAQNDTDYAKRLRFLIKASKSIVFSFAFTSVSVADVKKNFISFRKEILPYLIKGALS